ncbi:hypothetical protein KEM52_004533, partial [Ascosphaera acerosa]
NPQPVVVAALAKSSRPRRVPISTCEVAAARPCAMRAQRRVAGAPRYVRRFTGALLGRDEHDLHAHEVQDVAAPDPDGRALDDLGVVESDAVASLHGDEPARVFPVMVVMQHCMHAGDGLVGRKVDVNGLVLGGMRVRRGVLL